MAVVMKEMERKVTKIGNSLGVTLPTEVLEHIKAKQGDQLKFELDQDGSVKIKKHEVLNLVVLEGIDQDFLDGLKFVFDNYDQTLKNLAKR